MTTSQFAFKPADETAAPGALPRLVRMFSTAEAPRYVGSWVRMTPGRPASIGVPSPKTCLWVSFASSKHDRSGRFETPVLRLIKERLTELREIAVDEGTSYSDAGEADLKQFLSEAAASTRPAIYLLEDGSLRVKWRNLQGEQIGLQFSGGGSVQMVFFVQRRTGAMARVIGQDTLEGALCQVRSLGLQPLLRA